MGHVLQLQCRLPSPGFLPLACTFLLVLLHSPSPIISSDQPFTSLLMQPSSSTNGEVERRSSEPSSFKAAGLSKGPGKGMRKLPPPTNTNPLIGILSQPGDGDGGYAPRVGRWARRTSSDDQGLQLRQGASGAVEEDVVVGKKRGARNDSDVSYIAASYVKWVEAAGARPVPLLYDEPMEELTRKFRAINGLIIPGGGTPLEPGPFFSAVQHLLNLALEANDGGDYFPVQGTCMGLEALTIFISEDFSILQLKKFASDDNPASLRFFHENAKAESLFAWMTPHLLARIQKDPLTMENHGDGTTVDRFLSSARLVDFFDILTTSVDKNGTEYVSTVKGKEYPFFGTQWHPEKACFEWGLPHIPHNADAVAVCQAAANAFVNEARRSRHAPKSEEELDELLIYNFDPIFSGKHGKGFFEQSYVFKKYEPPAGRA